MELLIKDVNSNAQCVSFHAQPSITNVPSQSTLTTTQNNEMSTVSFENNISFSLQMSSSENSSAHSHQNINKSIRGLLDAYTFIMQAYSSLLPEQESEKTTVQLALLEFGEICPEGIQINPLDAETIRLNKEVFMPLPRTV